MNRFKFLLLALGVCPSWTAWAHEDGPRTKYRIPLAENGSLELDYFSTKLKPDDEEYKAAMKDGVTARRLENIDRVAHTIYHANTAGRTAIIEYVEIAPNGGLNTSAGPAFALIAGSFGDGVCIFVIHTSPVVTARVVEKKHGAWQEVEKRELDIGNVEKYENGNPFFMDDLL